MRSDLQITVTYKIKVLSVEGNLPIDLEAEFDEWLKFKAIELGSGVHHEYFCHDSSHIYDVGVKFDVSTEDTSI